MLFTETIVAIATPPGRGGVGILRLSGETTATLARAFLGREPKPRQAHFCRFQDAQGQLIDEGLLLFFPAPSSFTGESVLELQTHGSPVILDRLLEQCIHMGARLARPGEFSERAFLNGKIDLLQAEAVADLINAGTRLAAQSAMRSLQGEFSRVIQLLQKELTTLRILIEANIDFSDEDDVERGPLAETAEQLKMLLARMAEIKAQTQCGVRLQEGLYIALIGLPNAGKSSLLNRLCGEDRAIISPIAGTTRDVLQASVQIDGLPFHLLDTAGLRTTLDPIEQEGVIRAKNALEKADLVLWVIDATVNPKAEMNQLMAEIKKDYPEKTIFFIRNKIDLVNEKVDGKIDYFPLSVVTGRGFTELLEAIKEHSGISQSAPVFTARRRHIIALEQAEAAIQSAYVQCEQQAGLELLAEELRMAQQFLGEMTGEYTSDDLLGDIFSSFCIGK